VVLTYWALSLISTSFNKPTDGTTNAAGTESVTRKKTEESGEPVTAPAAPVTPIAAPEAAPAPGTDPNTK